MTTLTTTPRADDFHMPAEWALHSQTWMVWPQRPDNWRNDGAPAQAAFVAVAKAIARFDRTIALDPKRTGGWFLRFREADFR